MKKTYEKPVLAKKGRLSAITAVNGASGPTPQ
ncbi:putative RiPP precursor [Mesorhizobium waimense]|uniref:Putative RiPP n=1 Tax=Mesorhizobium waimense TaxID=1300307 RepID=A0A3A5KKZ2_9HYPH|nr:putative RiPP precursor [Mesorhizobium waimense]RJT36449.1 putative RiPP precursor [Mesorhizobium waimense]